MATDYRHPLFGPDRGPLSPARLLVRRAGEHLESKAWADVAVDVWDEFGNPVVCGDGTDPKLIPSGDAPVESRDPSRLKGKKADFWRKKKAPIVRDFIKKYEGQIIDGVYYTDGQGHIHAYSHLFDDWLIERYK